MAFHELDRGVLRRPRKTSSVSLWVSKNGTASLCVSGDIHQKIGSPMFAKLLLGTGEHSGFLAIIPRNMPGASAYKMSMVGNGAYQRKITVSSNRIGITKDKRLTTTLPFEITDEGLIVDLRMLRPVVVAERAFANSTLIKRDQRMVAAE